MIIVNKILFIFICILALIGALTILRVLIQIIWWVIVGIIYLVCALIDKIKK